MPRPRKTVAAGYGAPHRKLRAEWAQRIAGGWLVPCARCRQPILPTQKWCLDHRDDLPGRIAHNLGLYLPTPSHARCNQGARNNRSTQRPRPPALSYFDPPPPAPGLKEGP